MFYYPRERKVERGRGRTLQKWMTSRGMIHEVFKL